MGKQGCNPLRLSLLERPLMFQVKLAVIAKKVASFNVMGVKMKVLLAEALFLVFADKRTEKGDLFSRVSEHQEAGSHL